MSDLPDITPFSPFLIVQAPLHFIYSFVDHRASSSSSSSPTLFWKPCVQGVVFTLCNETKNLLNILFHRKQEKEHQTHTNLFQAASSKKAVTGSRSPHATYTMAVTSKLNIYLHRQCAKIVQTSKLDAYSECLGGRRGKCDECSESSKNSALPQGECNEGDYKVNYLYCVAIYNALDSIDSIVKRRAVWLGFLYSPRLALLLPPVSSLRGVDKFHHSSIILP